MTNFLWNQSTVSCENYRILDVQISVKSTFSQTSHNAPYIWKETKNAITLKDFPWNQLFISNFLKVKPLIWRKKSWSLLMVFFRVEKYFKTRSRFLRENQHFFRQNNVFAAMLKKLQRVDFPSNQCFFLRSYYRVDFTEIFERDRVL